MQFDCFSLCTYVQFASGVVWSKRLIVFSCVLLIISYRTFALKRRSGCGIRWVVLFVIFNYTISLWNMFLKIDTGFFWIFVYGIVVDICYGAWLLWMHIFSYCWRAWFVLMFEGGLWSGPFVFGENGWTALPGSSEVQDPRIGGQRCW